MNDHNSSLDDTTCELLDLYVAGALDSEECIEAEAIISESDSAQAYVDEARDMFARFQDDAPFSPTLLADVKKKFESTGVGEQKDNVVSISSRGRFVGAFLAGAVAASLAVFMISSISTTTPSPQAATSMNQMMKTFKKSSGTHSVTLMNPQGDKGAQVMMRSSGDIMIDARNLPQLDDASTYQLWAVVDSDSGKKVISAGVLGNHPGITMSRVTGDVTAFVITQEVAGGVEKSSQDPAYIAKVA